MAADTTLSEPTGRRPDRPALRSDPASEQRARDVMGSALGVVAPSAVPLRDGSIRLTTADDVLPARIVERIHERLTRRAADHANEHRMLGEAVALLGDSVCRARGGPSPVDAATGALDTLLDVPGLPPESRTEAEALLRRILQADPERATGPEPSPRATDVAREARAIGREARELGTAAARTGPAAEQRRTTEGRHAGAHRRTEAGRTVGAPRVAGTGFVAGGRPADDPDLTAAEALRALTRVRRDDLGGTLTADPAALAGPGLAAVDSATLGRQHFQVRISPPGRRRVAATEVRAGTVSDPHVLRISPRLADAQLARVWVHAISHTLQEVQAVRAGRDAGFLAKAWAVVTRKGRDRLVTAQYDEYRMLARDWRDAHAAGLPTENLERDLRGLSIAIARRGHPEPAPPWAPGILAVTPAPSAVAGPDARQGPAPNTLPHLRSRVSAQVTVLDSAVADLRQRAEAKDETAAEAGVLAADKRGEAGAERELRDRAAPERARKLDAEAVAAEDKQRRHTELAGSYRYAAALAERARDAYKDVLAEAETVATDPGCSTARLVELTDAAGRRAEEYRRSVVAALPPRDALHTGTPTGRLPHLTALTERINATLAERGIAHRFTPEMLHRTLRAEFRRITSGDGLVLPVGDGHGDVDRMPQLRIRLRPGELAEVTDPDVRLAGMMVGQLEQGGHSVASTATRSMTTHGGLSLRPLVAALPDGSTAKAVGSAVAPGFEYAFGRSRSVTTAATEYALGGAVEDNRGESLLFEAPATWEIDVRDSALGKWAHRQTVDSGGPRDARTLRLWLSHAYTVAPPADRTDLAREGDNEQPAAALPEHVATGIAGLDELTDDVAAQTRARLGSLDTVAYDQLRGLLTEDLPSRLDEASRPGGIGRLITDNGRPVAYVQVRTRVVRETARMVGVPSTAHWQERLRVGFSGATGSQSFAANTSGSVSLSHGFADVGPTTVDAGPSLSAGRATSRTDELSAGGTAIHPSVQRYTGPTQAYLTRLEHTVTVHRIDGGDAFAVEGGGSALLRIPEHDAFRYGLPVAAAAVRRRPDGQPLTGPDGRALLRGDPAPAQLTPPAWLGTGEHQLRGAGPALVQKVSGADQALTQVLQELSRRRLVPALDAEGRPIMSELPRDHLERADQLLNLERVSQQLSALRLETGYDQAAQGGIPLALVRHRPGRAPQTVTLRLALHQRWDEATSLGLSTSDAVVNLDIGSNTSGRTAGRSKRLPWKARLGAGDRPAPGHGGTTPEGGLSYGRNALGRSTGLSVGGTVNQVTLVESTAPVAVFDVPHALVVTEVTPKGDSEPLAAVEGSARVLIDSELLLPEPAATPHQELTGEAVLDRATILHLDAGDVLARLRAELPAATRPDASAMHHLAAFVNPRNLIAHPEWTQTRYSSRFTYRTRLGSGEATVALRGHVRDHLFLGATSQVTGDINLTLSSFGTTSGRSTGGTVELSGADGSATASGGGWHASASANRSSSASRSETDLSIWGWERLMIEVGQQYVFRAGVGFEADLTDREGGTARRVELAGGTMLFTLPEREALRLYGRRELDLPVPQVADAVERYLTGKLTLDGRTATTLVRRYREEKDGVTDGLAASHTHERLVAALRETAGVPAAAGDAEHDLDTALEVTEPLAERPAEVSLPEHYRDTMGAALIESVALTGPDGAGTDLLGEVRAAVERVAPGALDADPVLAESLYGDLAGRRWRGHLDDMLDPRGFVRDYPVKAAGAGPGVGPADLLTVRVRAELTGPALTDGTPDAPAESAIILVQGYDYDEHSRTDTRGTTYAAHPRYGAGGDLVAGGAGTDRGRTVSAGSGEQLTRLQRLGHFSAARVERGVRLVVEVQRTPVRGAATRGRVMQAADRHPANEPVTTGTELSGRLTQLVPRALVGATPAPVAAADQPRDHRVVSLPSGYFVEGTRPYPRGEPAADTLFDTVYERLARRDLLTSAGMRLHRTELENQLSASARSAAFERIAGDEGHRLVRLPVPGHRTAVVDVRVRAVVSDVELVSGTVDEVEIGQVDRFQRTTRTSVQGNRLVPLGRDVEGAPVEDVKGGAGSGEQVSERVTDSTGNRNETSMFERGATVTVRVRLDYELSFERRAVKRDGSEKVKHAETVRNAAAGEAYLTMFEHEYRAMRERMESGAPVLPPFEHTWGAAMPPRAETRRVRADEYTGVGTGQMRLQPYQPLLDALAEARRDGVVVALTVHERDGTDRSYEAHPDGTMTGVDDGGFAAAFATLNPRLALLSEGRVDLRELYNTAPRSDRFTLAVTGALRRARVPDAVLDEAVHAVAPQRAVVQAQTGARRTIGGTGAGPAHPGTGIGVT